MKDLATIDTIFSRAERITKMLFFIIGLIMTGAIWATRMEFKINDLADWKTAAAADIKDHAKALENIKGRMGIAAAPAPPEEPDQSPSVAYKHDDTGADTETQ